MASPQTIEVHLEELGEHSWVKALANTVSGSHGSSQYRFVARPPGTGHRPSDHVVTGATFPVLRLQDLDDLHRPNAWVETAQERLDELDEELASHGWRPCPGGRQHWWSRTYVPETPHRERRGPQASSGRTEDINT
jgi:hypothetical protein